MDLETDEELTEDECIYKLKDVVPCENEEDVVPADDDIEAFSKELELHTSKFKMYTKQIFKLQSDIDLISKRNQDLIDIVSRTKGLVGYEKVREGVQEYLDSLDLEGLRKTWNETKFKVKSYLSSFKSLRELDKYSCFVCLETTCDTFLDPCGHAVCYVCSKRIANKCPFCRTVVCAKKIHWAL